MDLLGPFQTLVSLALGVAALIATGFSFVDALRRPQEAFSYAGKRTKTFWLVVLGIALAVVFVLFTQGPLNFLVLLSVVAAGVYLADVRPAVRQYRGGRGGSGRGPYGGY
jgi:uncharacterized membrane protein